jgi:hypothetical protein
VRLPDSAHTSQPWRIHALTADLELLDVWALPTPGGPDDFSTLVDLMTAFDPTRGSSAVVRSLFAIRFTLGRLLGWDSAATGLGRRVPSLRDRLPPDLRDAPLERRPAVLGFEPVYRLGDELAVEIANATVHGVLHLGWAADDAGYRGQMAILVKPNGLLGAAYLAVIEPFRHLIVYPGLMREIDRRWRTERSACLAAELDGSSFGAIELG